MPSAFRVAFEPVVTPAKAGARTRRLIFCRGAAQRSRSQDCAQAVHATEALVVSRGRATYALSKVLNSCHMAHAGVAPPGTVPVARCSACREAGRAAAGTPGSSLRVATSRLPSTSSTSSTECAIPRKTQWHSLCRNWLKRWAVFRFLVACH